MQHFTKFGNETDYIDYIDDTPIVCQLPNVSTIVDSTDVRYAPRDYSKEYLTLKFMGANTLSFAGLGSEVLSYSDDKGETWKTANSGTSISTEKGTTLWFKGNLNRAVSGHQFVTSNATSNGFLLSGNIMSLYFGDNFEGHTDQIYCNYMFSGTSCISAINLILPSLTLYSTSYFSMFQQCQILKYAPKILPATTLASNCYKNMFYYCSNLKTAPILPAITLAANCYYSMFQGCTSLVTAPELPATTLASYCYYQMFTNCTALENAPELPATALANYCYEGMFGNCTNLEIAPKLPAMNLATQCYGRMFSNCTGMVKAPELPATTLTAGCYMRMFGDCSSLEKAPDLLAKTLVEDCYHEMFDGCSSLEFIRCYATNATEEESYLYYWVQNVSDTGTFVKLSGATWYDGNNGIPEDWDVEEEAEPTPPVPPITADLVMYIDDFDNVMEDLIDEYGSFANYMNYYLPDPEAMGGNTYRYTNEVVQYGGSSYYLWENITQENPYPSYALTSTVDYDTLYNNSMEEDIENRYQPIVVFVDDDIEWQYDAPQDGVQFVLVKVVDNS